jgi:glutathione S-transferase
MRLLLGNKNYSSWSMRAGVVAAAFDLPVATEMLWLDEPGAAATKRACSPAGRVPILVDGDLTIWDSLAICEYWAERFSDRGLWPGDRADRARARALAAEMHSGFLALRHDMPMNLRSIKPTPDITPSLDADLARLFEIFAGARGPFQLGEFSITDACFAPVATRLRTYQIEVPTDAAAYAQRLLAHPAVVDWVADGAAETRRLPMYD